jgi:hypothetical protein
MSHTSIIFALFPFIVGVMLFGIWSNIHAYAQQSSSSSSPTLSPSTGNSASKPVSSELKAKICDPTNPDLKVVNTTEARLCGIPKTVKPSLPSTPPTSAVSSSPPSTQQTITTKPAVAAPTQQQIKAVNNTHMNTISRPTGGHTGTTIAPVSQPSTTNASSSPSGIAPQIKAVNQQLQQSLIKGINGTTGINNTAATPVNSTSGQNYTFAATSLPAASDQFLYLGYHGRTKSNHDNSGLNHDDEGTDSNSKPDNHRTTKSVSDGSSEDKEAKQLTPHRIKNIATNHDSTPKKRFSSSTKLDGTDNVRNDHSHSRDKIKSDTKPPHIKIIPPEDESKTTKKKTTATSKEDVSPPTNDNNNSKDKNSPDTESSDSENPSSFKKTRAISDTKGSISDDVNGDSSTKSSVHGTNSGSTVTSDNDSKDEKKSQTTNDDSNSKKGKSGHTDDDSKLFSASSSDLASSIRNKVDSIIRNSLEGIGHNLFGFSDNGGF